MLAHNLLNIFFSPFFFFCANCRHTPSSPFTYFSRNGFFSSPDRLFFIPIAHTTFFSHLFLKLWPHANATVFSVVFQRGLPSSLPSSSFSQASVGTPGTHSRSLLLTDLVTPLTFLFSTRSHQFATLVATSLQYCLCPPDFRHTLARTHRRERIPP